MLRYWGDGIKDDEDSSGGFPGMWGQVVRLDFTGREIGHRLGMAGSPPGDPLSPRAGGDGTQRGWMASP